MSLRISNNIRTPERLKDYGRFTKRQYSGITSNFTLRARKLRECCRRLCATHSRRIGFFHIISYFSCMRLLQWDHIYRKMQLCLIGKFQSIPHFKGLANFLPAFIWIFDLIRSSVPYRPENHPPWICLKQKTYKARILIKLRNLMVGELDRFNIHFNIIKN